MLHDLLMREMKRVFGGDARQVRHTIEVLRYAEEILRRESGDPVVVRAAAILHDIGIPEARRRYGSSAGRYQELEGPPIVRRMLAELDVDPEQAEHICRIVGAHHTGRAIDTPEFRIVWDADWLARMTDRRVMRVPAKVRQLAERCTHILDRTFRTETGRAIAKDRFLS